MLLIRSSNRVDIGVALAGLPFEERMIARSTVFPFAPGVLRKTCFAEDLVVLKVLAGRSKHPDASFFAERARNRRGSGVVFGA